MLKRIMLMCLSCAILLSCGFLVTAEAATADVELTASYLVEKCLEIAELPTVYGSGGALSLGTWNGSAYTFDCNGLVHAILWGWDGNKNVLYGGASPKSNGVPELSPDGWKQHIGNGWSTDFSDIQPGEVLYMSSPPNGHFGVYVGEIDGVQYVVESVQFNRDGIHVNGGVQKLVLHPHTNGGLGTSCAFTHHAKLPYITYDPVITVAAGTGGTVTPDGTALYEKGTVIDLSATPAEGYRFSGWSCSAGTIDNPSAAQTTYIVSNEDAVVMANFSIIPKYEFSIEAGMGGEIIKGQNGHYREDESFEIGAKADSGYIFVRWQCGAGYVEDPYNPNTIYHMTSSNGGVDALFSPKSMDIDIFPSTIDFGEYSVNAQYITVTNNSDSPLPILVSEPEHFNIFTNTPVVEAKETVKIGLLPKTLINGGTFSDEIIVMLGDSSEIGRVLVSCTNATDYVLTPHFDCSSLDSDFDFGSMIAGGAVPEAQTLTFTYDGRLRLQYGVMQDLQLHDISLSYSSMHDEMPFIFTPASLPNTTMQTGDSFSITVKPKAGLAPGEYTANIHFGGKTDDGVFDGAGRSIRVNMDVYGTEVELKPNSIDFGISTTDEQPAQQKIITITNKTGFDIRIPNTPPESDHFLIDGYGPSWYPSTLHHGQTYQFTISPKKSLPEGVFDVVIPISFHTDHGILVENLNVKYSIVQNINITTPYLPAGLTGEMYSQTLQATGTMPIIWSIVSGELPTGLTLSADGTISGTPTTASTYTFTVKATNNAGSATKELTIVVEAAPVAPAIEDVMLANGTVDSTYSVALSATGDAPITWSVTSGELPTGLTLSADGTISGTPTTAGTYTFTVKATNDVGSDTKALTIVVEAAPVQPVAPIIGEVTPANGIVGTPYSLTLSATGDVPITWSVTSGDLPIGLILGADGTIAGTPTTAGSYTFTVKASNDAGDATKELTIVVEAVVAQPIVPEVVVKPSSTFVQGKAGIVTLSIGEEIDGFGIDNFEALRVDGSQLASSSNTYSVKNGSIIVQFSPTYLNTLVVGTHNVTVDLQGSGYEGMSVSTILRVIPQETQESVSEIPPKTGDKTPLMLLMILAIGACGGCLLLTKKNAKQ